MSHYLPVILRDKDLNNQNYTFTLTDEAGNEKLIYIFLNETTLEIMFKVFKKRHEDSQDSNKLTAIPSKTYELIGNTAEHLSINNLSGKTKHTSVKDKLCNDITQFNHCLTKIIELKKDFKTIKDTVKIVSEFAFLFWLDKIVHINE